MACKGLNELTSHSKNTEDHPLRHGAIIPVTSNKRNSVASYRQIYCFFQRIVETKQQVKHWKLHITKGRWLPSSKSR